MACAMGQQLKGEVEDGADVDIGRPQNITQAAGGWPTACGGFTAKLAGQPCRLEALTSDISRVA